MPVVDNTSGRADRDSPTAFFGRRNIMWLVQELAWDLRDIPKSTFCRLMDLGSELETGCYTVRRMSIELRWICRSGCKASSALAVKKHITAKVQEEFNYIRSQHSCPEHNENSYDEDVVEVTHSCWM